MLFSDILGQERAKSFLGRVIASGKIPHAYLFTGIPGIGKTSTAQALATALNCSGPVDGDGCGHCLACRQMVSGNFPDFLCIRPDGQNIKIDQIRDLKRRLGFSSVSGGYRVCVVCQAETMTDEASNSFLKTLEEPFPGNVLILNATEPLDLLPTIVSRCQRVPFQPLPVGDITDWLVLKRGVKEDEARVLARISNGSLGRALNMHEGDFLDKRERWLLRIMGLPGGSRDKAIEIALECAGEDKNSQDDVHKDRGGITDMLSVWETWYRDLLLLSTQGPDDLIVNMDFSHKLKNISRRVNIKNLIESILIIDRAQRELRRMRNRTLVMEHMVLNLDRLARG